MSPGLIVLVVVLLFLITLLFIPIGVGAKYENGTFVIVKLAVFSFDIPINKIIKSSPKKKKVKKEPVKKKKPEDDLEKSIIGLDFILSLLGDFRKYVRKRVKLTNFKLNISIGTSDAASTSITTGLLWSLSYNLLALIDKLVLVVKPDVKIEPVFNDSRFSISAKGIIETRIAHIIAVITVFVYKYLKYKKEKQGGSKK